MDLNLKYKPTSINDCYINDENKNKINMLIKNNSFQNTIFYGDTGTGKTTIINLILNLLNIPVKNIFRTNLLFGQNIDSLNSDIELFNKIIMSNQKVIIIENLDYIHHKVQKDIAIAINKFSNILFFIECNSIIDILPEIQNQCIMFEFKTLDKQCYIEYVNKICSLEKININNSVISELFILSAGNIRFSLIQLSSLLLISNYIDIKLFEHLYKIPNPTIIDNLINLCINKSSDTDIISVCDVLIKQKYSCNELLMGIFNNLIYNNVLDENIKNNFLEILGKYLYKNNKYIESPLQLKYCLLKISHALN